MRFPALRASQTIRLSLQLLLPVVGTLILAGCQGRSIGETAEDTLYSVEGGEIAKLRAPAPGYDKKYPNINLVPKTKLDFPSPEARVALTEKLEAQRNYAQRLTAASGPLPRITPSSPPPPMNTDASMTLASDNTSSASSPAQKVAVPAKSLTPSNAHPEESQPTSVSPQGAAPLQYAPIDRTLPKTLPAIIAPPASPIGFPGFVVPQTHEKVIPNFATATPPGLLVRFPASSDQPSSGQDKTFNQLVQNRGRHTIVVTGYGVTMGPEAGLQPHEQTAEIALALLRARTVADILIQRGVPAEEVLLAGEAIGDGVRARYALPALGQLSRKVAQ